MADKRKIDGGSKSVVNPLFAGNKNTVTKKKLEMIQNMRRKHSMKGAKESEKSKRRRASSLGSGVNINMRDIERSVAMKYGGDITKLNETERTFIQKLKNIDDDGDGSISLTEIINHQIKLERATMNFNIKDVEKIIMEKYDGQPENVSSEDQNLIFSLRSMDKDGDGDISLSEILAVQNRLQSAEKDKKALLRVVAGMAVLFVVFLIFTFLMTFAANEATKEMRVSNEGAMLSSAESRDAPTSTTAERRLEMAGPPDGDHLGPGLRRALGVRKMMQQRKLASTMPDKFFKELEWLELVAPTSATVSLRILSIVRIPRRAAKCGSFLMLVTVNGKVILDDTDIKFDDTIGSLFREAGFDMVEAQNAVEVDGNGQSRRLTEGNGFTATGFFNVIDDMEWECTTVAKPEFPAVYSAKITRLRKCIDKDGQDHCKVEIFDGETVTIHGVIEEDGVRYLKEHSNTYIDSSSQISVVTKPYHPGVKQVTHANNGETISYQVGADGTLSHCTLSDGEDSMKLPDDFIFHYVGLTGDMRHFRISYQPDNPFGEGKLDMWKHIDYFDSQETKLPKIIILDDESILRFDEIKVNIEMRSFREEGIQFEGLHFDQCLQVNEMITNGTFDIFKREYNIGNLTLPPLNGTSLDELEPDSFEFQIHAWNWTNNYPPAAHAPLSMKEDDVLFYTEQSNIDIPAIKEWNEWLNHTTQTLNKDLQQRARRLYDVQNYMGNRRLHELDEEELRGMLMRRKKGQFSRDARGRALWKWESKADRSKKELWAKLTHGSFYIHFGVKLAESKNDDIYLNFFIKCKGCYLAFCFYGGVDVNYPLVATNGAVNGGGYVKVKVSMSSFVDSLSLWNVIKTALKKIMPADMTIFSADYKYKALEIDTYGGRDVTYRSRQGITGYAGLNKQELASWKSWWGTKYGAYLTAKIDYMWDKWQSKRMYEKTTSGQGELWRNKAVLESKYKHVTVYTDPSNSNREVIDFGSGSKQKVDVVVDYKYNIPLYSSGGWKNVLKKTLFEKSQNEAVEDSEREKGVEIGVTRTESGYKCQSWSQIYPHKHSYSSLGDNNFCANPSSSKKGGVLTDWCYTTDPNKRWEFCNVKQTKTIDGDTCKNWKDTPYSKVGNHNYCRNPDGDSYDWCITTNPNVYWGYCSG